MSYKNPALIEICVEIFLKKESLTQDIFFDIIPNLKKSDFSKIEIGKTALNIDTSLTGTSINVVPRIRCWNSDSTKLIQFSPDLFVVNKVRPYLGWENFKDFFSTGYNALKNALLENLRIESMRLTAIDQINAPKEDFSLGKYLNCDGSTIPLWYKDSKEFADISLGKGFLALDNFNSHFIIAVRPSDSNVLINITSVFHGKNTSSDPLDLLETLHKDSLTSFEAMITDSTRNEIMGGLK